MKKEKKKLFNEIRETKEFKRDFKKLIKKLKTLNGDMETFIKTQLNLYHKLKISVPGIVRISDLVIDSPKIYKVRKFACRSLKGKGSYSGIRIIYVYYEEEDIVEFVEIYYKGDKENEDRERILKYYKKD